MNLLTAEESIINPSQIIASKRLFLSALKDIRKGWQRTNKLPIQVWRVENKFQLIDGYHRLCTFLIAGLVMVKVQIVEKPYHYRLSALGRKVKIKAEEYAITDNFEYAEMLNAVE